MPPLYPDHDIRLKSLSACVLEEYRGQLFILGDHDKSDLLVYDPGLGVFVPGERVVKRRIKELLGTHVRGSLIQEVYFLVHLEAPRKAPAEFDSNRDLITFSNRVLHIGEASTAGFSPQNLCRIAIPNPYNPLTRCPAIDQFLVEVVPPEYTPVIEEFLGCVLAGDLRFKKGLLLLGPGNSGTSVFLKLTEAMVGPSNTVNIPLVELVDRHFYRAELEGKRLNAVSDIEVVNPTQLGILKALIGGDRIHAEKKYKDPFPFTNTAVMMFSCNSLPTYRQRDYPVLRHFVIIPFPRAIEEREADRDLIEKLTSREELSGLINRAIAGYRRLCRNGHFSVPSENEQILQRYFPVSDSVARFLDECTEPGEPDVRTPKTELYEAYQQYVVDGCSDSGNGVRDQVVGRNRFSVAVRRLRPGVRSGKMLGVDRRDAWIGLRLIRRGEASAAGVADQSAV